MRIVSKAKDYISKVWGSPAPMDSTYRLLRYLVQEDCEEGTLLLNTVTGELILLDTEETDLLRGLPASHIQKMDELIAHHYLVPENFDDAKSVNQLRSILRKLNAKREITGFSIFPTSACNARCFYCYESSYPKKNMTPETADKVVDFIAANCGKKKRVEIEWFGGEPTLGEDQIDQICDGLKDKGIDYKSSTLSNGYLFTKDLAHKAKVKWKLQSVQISMDGTEDVYNKTKAYVNTEGSPYQRVLENIGCLLDEEIKVVVRLNLSFHNETDLKALIDELVNRYGKRKKFAVYVHEIFPNMGYSPVSYEEDELHKLTKTKIALNQYIDDSGCRVLSDFSSPGFIPYLKLNYCMADNPKSLLINPLGEFGRCDHYSFEHLVGNLESGCNFDASKISVWMNHDYYEWCKKCLLFPLCGQADFCVGKRECYPEELQVSVDGIKKRMRNKLSDLLGGKNEKASI